MLRSVSAAANHSSSFLSRWLSFHGHVVPGWPVFSCYCVWRVTVRAVVGLWWWLFVSREGVHLVRCGLVLVVGVGLVVRFSTMGVSGGAFSCWATHLAITNSYTPGSLVCAVISASVLRLG